MSGDNSLKVPNHLAVIMDGNRRWAKLHNLPTKLGHERGAKVARRFVEDCFELGIKYLTLFAFSSENWNRSADEISTFNVLLKHYLKNSFDKLIDKGIKVNFIGNLDKFDSEVRGMIGAVQEKSSSNSSFVLNIALSYGGRADICFAIKKICKKVIDNEILLDQIDEKMLSQNLMTAGVPDPDLLIRTSGESRISNFLNWQLSYTELYFSNKLWPDFTKEDLFDVIREYSIRERRYGN